MDLNVLNFSNFKINFIVLIIFMFIDVVSGIIYSVKNKNLKSSKFRDGLYKKFATLILVVTSLMMGTFTELDLFYDVFYVVYAYECLSILENISLIGVKIPNKIKQVLLVISEKDLEGGVKNDES